MFSGCEDVVNVNLKTEKPKLVIEASINWDKGTAGNNQKIRISTTTNYYSDAIPTVSGAIVTIKNSENTVFDFIEIQKTGIYICTDFVPLLNETYTLTVTSNGQTYTATETLKSVAAIDHIVQNNQGGIVGTNIEVRTFYDDPSNQENYYLYKYNYSNKIKVDYYVDEDTFFQGNTFFSVSQNDKLAIGDKVEISHFGISKQYYNYMKILLSIAGNNGGGPFQSPPVSLKGNIINTTDFNNNALGYFRLSEVDSKNYTVQ